MHSSRQAWTVLRAQTWACRCLIFGTQKGALVYTEVQDKPTICGGAITTLRPSHLYILNIETAFQMFTQTVPLAGDVGRKPSRVYVGCVARHRAPEGTITSWATSPASPASAPAKDADDASDAGDVAHAGEGTSGNEGKCMEVK